MNYIDRDLATADLTFLAEVEEVLGAWVRYPDKDENYLIRERERTRQARGQSGPRYCRCGANITGRNGNAKSCRPCAYLVDLEKKKMQARKEAARARGAYVYETT